MIAQACDQDGAPVTYGRPSPGASRTTGAVAGGYAVVATARGYRGVALT